jgi:hypothetical protein
MSPLNRIISDEVLNRSQAVIHLKDDRGAPRESYRNVLSRTYDLIVKEIKSVKEELIEDIMKHI